MSIVSGSSFTITINPANKNPWPTQTPAYLPVVRNLAGPGVDTPAGSGRGGTGTPVIYRVSGEPAHLSGGQPSDASLLTAVGDGYVPSSTLMATTPPYWPQGLVALANSGTAVRDAVLAFAGSRPASRSLESQRVVDTVKNDTGSYQTTVAGYGDWPAYPVNLRPLTLPGSPHVVAGNQYTNLENWLHGHEDAVI